MPVRIQVFILGLLAVCAVTLTAARQAGQASGAMPDLDPGRPVAQRVDDLLARMTLDEKVGQMTQPDHSYLKSPDDVGKYFLGSVLSGGDSEIPDVSAAGWTTFVAGLQRRALATRLRIPLLYGIDAVHGHNNVRGRGGVSPQHRAGLHANPSLSKRPHGHGAGSDGDRDALGVRALRRRSRRTSGGDGPTKASARRRARGRTRGGRCSRPAGGRLSRAGGVLAPPSTTSGTAARRAASTRAIRASTRRRCAGSTCRATWRRSRPASVRSWPLFNSWNGEKSTANK